MIRIHVEVISDTLCPWCYIGKKHLDQAIHLFRQRNPTTVFEVEWKPFYVYPKLERIQGQPKAVLMEPIPPEIQHQIIQAGIHAGISFRLDAGTTGPSTASHALLRLALRYSVPDAASSPSPPAFAHASSSASGNYQSMSPGTSSSPGPGFFHSTSYPSPQSRLLDALFAAHFERGLDISSPALLVALAEESGVSRHDAQSIVANDMAIRETDAEAEASRRRAKAIPTFIIQGHWEVRGMQEPGMFLDIFEKAAQRQRRGMSLREMLIDDSAL